MNKKYDKEKVKRVVSFVLEEYDEALNVYCEENNHNNILEDIDSMEDDKIEKVLEYCMHDFYLDMKICDCGVNEDTHNFMRLVLDAKTSNLDEWDSRDKKMNSIFGIEPSTNKIYNGMMQFVLHALELFGFLEHGVGVSGSWRTKKGNAFLELLELVTENESK